MVLQTASDKHAWWSELKHGGVLISPAVLSEQFPHVAQPGAYSYYRLRDRYNSFASWWEKQTNVAQGDAAPLHAWLDAVLEEFLGHGKALWLKGSDVPPSLAIDSAFRERLRPNRVLYRSPDKDQPAALVLVDRVPRLGQGRGRSGYSKLLELLRASGVKLGILTNGMQIRLCYAGLDYDAWAEWDASAWFDEGELRYQLDGFYTLLGAGLQAQGKAELPLLNAVESSRTRQGDLSTVLGEQVREAVELLLSNVDAALRKDPAMLDIVRCAPDDSPELPRQKALDAIYQAVCRLIMRMVVVLFAEARGLLPRDSAAYNESYGIEGLYTQLRFAVTHEGFRALEERKSAWSRLLGLFRLVHDGSISPLMAVPAYGGLLFDPGAADDPRSVLRALALLESVEVSDADVFRVLEKLKVGAIKVKRGRSTTWVRGPVDFRDLRTEYIGIMYEGLLDYELKSEDRTMVILNIGQEPVMPLDTLQNMPEKNLKDLLDKLAKEKASGLAAGGEEAAEEEPEDEPAEEEPSGELELVAEDADDSSDSEVELEETEAEEQTEDQQHQEAIEWAVKAVQIGGLVKKPRGKKGQDDYYYQQECRKAAHNLIKRVLDSGDLYLVRWGGTRKGSGTFYTKPGLAVPTVHRTLEPLCYDKVDGGKLQPKTPEDILSLKVCDPSCGSASFLVAALHYLTEALYKSLIVHRNIDDEETWERKTLPFGLPSQAGLQEDVLPCRPSDAEFDNRVKSRLRRYVVERCIYGVDINPMAVELARLSLWIETMDPELPFGFLDHKIKAGNSLVGCWFDRFREYPLAAWLREGGDKNHTNGIHYQKEEWTKAIKQHLNAVIKPEMVSVITGQLTFKHPVLADPGAVHDEALAVFEKLHNLAKSADGIRQMETLYYTELRQNESWRRLKDAFDTWCAVWFWPADRLDVAPTPVTFLQPSEDTLAEVRRLADQHRFFHWELEFPDVFTVDRAGFDALLGNPPWDVSKPNSKEFFSNADPIYRTYGKQEALSQQERLFQADAGVERDWLVYSADFKSMSNWCSSAAHPYGDPEEDGGDSVSLARGGDNARWHRVWRDRRAKADGYADRHHPFQHQGSADVNTYKLFLELSHALLDERGRLGMIVPSSLYTDKGAIDLRRLFLDRCRWEWLFGFENKQGIFSIHRSFKFCPVVIQKGGVTSEINAAFMRHELSDWETPERFSLPYPKEQAKKFSPNSRAILEVRSKRDLELLEKIYANSVLLGDDGPDGWGIKYATEFHMTNDSKLFPPRPKWEEKGYRPDIYGRWLLAENSPADGLDVGVIPMRDGTFVREEDIKGIALPLYEGRMVEQFDFSERRWVSGSGRNATWSKMSFGEKLLEPQYLMTESDFASSAQYDTTARAGFLDITTSVHHRTVLCTFLAHLPCGNKVPILRTGNDSQDLALLLVAVMNGFPLDFAARCRLVGMTMNYHILAELPLLQLRRNEFGRRKLISATAALCWPSVTFAPNWLALTGADAVCRSRGVRWRLLWAVTHHERLRLRCILDAIVADLYGLDEDDFAWILRDDPSDPKGFWRVDKDQPKELRHTTLAQVAFRDLKEMGMEAFCNHHDGDGWQIPESITFATRDGGILDLDAKDGSTYPVRDRLGPRFLPWQLEQSVEDSWAECEIHARNILGEEGFKKLQAELSGEVQPSEGAKNGPTDLFGNPVQTDLFGNPVVRGRGK